MLTYQIKQGHVKLAMANIYQQELLSLGSGDSLQSLWPNSFFTASKENLQNNLFCRLDRNFNIYRFPEDQIQSF